MVAARPQTGGQSKDKAVDHATMRTRLRAVALRHVYVFVTFDLFVRCIIWQLQPSSHLHLPA